MVITEPQSNPTNNQQNVSVDSLTSYQIHQILGGLNINSNVQKNKIGPTLKIYKIIHFKRLELHNINQYTYFKNKKNA